MPRVTPINVGESIIEPFFDSDLIDLNLWRVDDGKSHGLTLAPGIFFSCFEWNARPADGVVLKMRRAFALDCSEYDQVVLCLVVSQGCIVKLEAVTDQGQGKLAVKSNPAPTSKFELPLTLSRAKRLEEVTITVETAKEGPGGGYLVWLMLRNTPLAEAHHRRWHAYEDGEWPVHLAGPEIEPTFCPHYGLAMTGDELAEQRQNYRGKLKAGEADPYADLLEKAQNPPPEEWVDEHCFIHGHDKRFNRENRHGMDYPVAASTLARAGIIAEDRKLLRMAARVAMSKAISRFWDESPLMVFPGGLFEHRCFSHTVLLEEICTTLDLAWDCFSERGRKYLLRRIAEEGLGRTNFIFWKHDYIFKNNQAAAFSPGRILAYAVLEREWKHVTPYLELAYQELLENFDHILLPDGGYAEGPAYFQYGVSFGIKALEYYARARNRTVEEVLPQRLHLTAQFAAVLTSTDKTHDLIAIGDAGEELSGQAFVRFAQLLPHSHWVTLTNKARQREDSVSPSDLPPSPEAPAFLSLPNWGALASHRKLNGEPVKIFMGGCTRDADHNHEDKGGFVLELAGETYAMDMGGYLNPANPLAGQCKHAQMHNMLTPWPIEASTRAKPVMPHPTRPLESDLIPQGQGDEVRFHGRIDVTSFWPEHFSKCVRTLDSPTPDRIVITDQYATRNGAQVVFYWQTRLPVTIDKGRVTIQGQKGSVWFDVPPDCGATLEEMQPDPEHWPVHRRIAIHKPASQGTLEIVAHLEVKR